MHKRKMKRIQAVQFVGSVSSKRIRKQARVTSGGLTDSQKKVFTHIKGLVKHAGTLLDRPMDAMALGVLSVIKAQRTKKSPFFKIKKRGRKDNIVLAFNKRDYERMSRRHENMGM